MIARFRVVVFFAFLVNVFPVCPAGASFFDDSDGKWWMNKSQWSNVEGFNSDNYMTMAEQDDRLEFTSSFPAVAGEAFVGKASKWVMSLDHDFEVALKVHYQHVGVSNDDKANLSLDFMSSDWDFTSGDVSSLKYQLALLSENKMGWKPGEGKVNDNRYASEEDFQDGTSTGTYWDRPSADGEFLAHYYADQDKMSFSTMDLDGNYLGGTEIMGIKEKAGTDYVRLIVGSWSAGASFNSEDAYMTDLKVDAVMTPEPVSMLLFGVGGAVMAFARRLRSRNDRKK